MSEWPNKYLLKSELPIVGSNPLCRLFDAKFSCHYRGQGSSRGSAGKRLRGTPLKLRSVILATATKAKADAHKNLRVGTSFEDTEEEDALQKNARGGGTARESL